MASNAVAPGDAAPASAVPQALRDPWPRPVTLAGSTALVYLPQINSWQGRESVEFMISDAAHAAEEGREAA